MIDDRTEGRGYLKPHATNRIKDDVERLRSALDAVDTDITDLLLEMGHKATLEHGHDIADIAGLQAALDNKIDVDGLSFDLDNLSVVEAAGAANGQVLMRVSELWVPVALQINHVSGLEDAITAIGSTVGSRWNTAAVTGAPAKATPVDTDVIPLVDSVLKRLSWASVKAALKAYYDAIYAATGHGHGAVTTTDAGFMAAADKIKLNGIATGAQVNPTAAALKTAYESNANTNAFTDALQTKLAGIATGATANASDATNRARANHTGTQDITSTTSGTLPVSRGGTGEITEAGMRGVYTGTNPDNTSFAIGSTIWVADHNGDRVSNVSPRLSGGSGFANGGSDTLLAGTWRSRGKLAGNPGVLAQRTA